jgi:hypothetical protein
MVEIGGWHTKFLGQNPPAEFLEDECRQQVPWILSLIQKSPLISISQPKFTMAEAGQYIVEVTVTNDGYLPTNLTERGLAGRGAAQVVKPPAATINLQGASLVDGSARIVMNHLNGSSPYSASITERSQTVRWTVRRDAPGATFSITVASSTGGIRRTGEVVSR